MTEAAQLLGLSRTQVHRMRGELPASDAGRLYDAVLRARAADVPRLVREKAMPPGNQTGITQEERDALVAWAVGSSG